MTYTLLFQKSDTLNGAISASDTSLTLTSGSFGSPSGGQLYVIDYDIPAKAEVVKVTFAGTAGTSMTRGLDGTTGVAHSSGAKILAAFVPSHHERLKDGTDLADNSIQGRHLKAGEVSNDKLSLDWEDFTPTLGGITIGNGSVYSRKCRIGNTAFYNLKLQFGSTTSASGTFSFTLPYPCLNPSSPNTLIALGSAYGNNSGVNYYHGVVQIGPNGTSCGINSDGSTTYWTNTSPFTWGANDSLSFIAMYEIDTSA